MDMDMGLEALGFTEVFDELASPLSSPDLSLEHAERGARPASGGQRRPAPGGGPSPPPPPPPGGGRRGGRPPAAAPDAAECSAVYVSNLAYAVSRAALARLFAPCGEVKRVSIPLDAVGRPQGHAYIEFAAPHEAQAALHMAGAEIGGRALRISLKRSGGSSAGSGGAERGKLAPHQLPQVPLAPPPPPPPPPLHHRASEPGHGRAAGGARSVRSERGARGARQGGGSGGAPGAPGGRSRGVSDDASYYQLAPPRHSPAFAKTSPTGASPTGAMLSHAPPPPPPLLGAYGGAAYAGQLSLGAGGGGGGGGSSGALYGAYAQHALAAGGYGVDAAYYSRALAAAGAARAPGAAHGMYWP